MKEKKMPSQGAHLALVVIGFFMGIIWGALSVSPYKKMKAAISSGDAEIAYANAKKIKIFAIIGIVINVLALIGRLA